MVIAITMLMEMQPHDCNNIILLGFFPTSHTRLEMETDGDILQHSWQLM